jgi:hypothetical protein
MVRFLSRAELLSLTGDSVDRFDWKVRSGNLPTLRVDGQKRGKYTPLEALLMIIANALSDAQHLAPTRAAEIASQAAPLVELNMRKIAQTSEQHSQGAPPKADIFFAKLLNPNADGSPPSAVRLCDTFAQIARKFPSPVQIDLVNVSRCAAEMRARASRADIDLDEFWKGE